MIPLPWLLFGLLVLVFVGAFGCYALRDFAYSRLEELCERKRVPERFREILTQQSQALLALELVVTGSVLVSGILAYLWLGPLPAGPPGAMVLRLVEYGVAVMVILIVADLLPWTLAQVRAEAFLYRFWPVIHGLLVVLRPVLVVVRMADRYAHRFAGLGDPEADDASVIDEEIRTVVDEGRREGVLHQDAGVMIERVMELQHDDVSAILTPRTDMICIQIDCTLEEARRQLLESGHSRVPTYGDSTDDILGILYAKDLLRALEPNRQPGEPIPVLRDLIREPVYVPVTTEIPALLELMKRQHVQIAIVLDEYGGVAGLVTMEDILEEIVGEIEDEYDEDVIRQRISIVSDTVAEVDARVHLDDLNERFGYGLPEDQEFDTIGGFVFSLLGHMPTAGEELKYRRLKFTVLAADRRKITRLRIERDVPQDDAASLQPDDATSSAR
uniref:HlyC/CorC family transporter n=1 Tax=Schlesneria paludicola TaxID=360056 RepID=A0A7C2NZP6_9PLAN